MDIKIACENMDLNHMPQDREVPMACYWNLWSYKDPGNSWLIERVVFSRIRRPMEFFTNVWFRNSSLAKISRALFAFWKHWYCESA